MKIEIKIEEANLKNINLGSEGNDENPVSRLDLNFEGLTNSTTLETLLGTQNASKMWLENGDLDFLGIKNIESSAELPDCTMSFHGVTIKECKAKKFKLHPHSGRVAGISLQLQIHHTPDELVKLDKLQKKVGTLVIKSTGQIDIASTVPDNQQGLDLD